MMNENKIIAIYGHLQESERKLDYFFVGVAGALRCADSDLKRALSQFPARLAALGSNATGRDAAPARTDLGLDGSVLRQFSW